MISFVYSITDKAMKDYIVYKPYLVFFGLMNGLYTSVFKVSFTGYIVPAHSELLKLLLKTFSNFVSAFRGYHHLH